jgi:DNA-binding PadR family transcriptional regulator
MPYSDTVRNVLEQLGRPGVTTMLAGELRDGSAGRLHPGSMYVTLARMEDREIIQSFDAGKDGRCYQITAKGRVQLARYPSTLPKALALPPRDR